MNIFNSIIADKLICGIGELQTRFDEPNNLVDYAFRIFLPTSEIEIKSDSFNATAANDEQRDAWLQRYYSVKSKISKLLNEPGENEVHDNLVNDCFISIKDHLDKVFAMLAPGGPTLNQPVNAHIERIHIEVSKLKQLALKA